MNTMTCPTCGKRMLMNFKTNVVSCPGCGTIRPDEISQIGTTVQAVKAKGQRPAVEITFKGELLPAALAAFETGQDLLFKGDKPAAIDSFKRAIAYQPDFVDAHLWIAKASDDEQVKRDYLGNVLAQMGTHLEATRMMMVLNGRLSAAEAARTYDLNAAPINQTADEVAAKIQALLCPQCGGHLTLDEANGLVRCASCGYHAPQVRTGAVGEDSLMMALIERRAKPVRWNIGKRVFQCNQCGAQHTLTAEKLSARCRFCGSAQVIVQDAVGSFEQPDGIIPFQITAESARASIDRHLSGVLNRMNEFLLSGNKVVAISPVEGAYLPFWAFDMDVEITQTRTNYGNVFQDEQPTVWLDVMPDMVVCAVKGLPERITDDLTDYDLSAAVPYEPKWLAKYPAQLYEIDFDKASYEARGRAADQMRLKYRPVQERTYSDSYGKERKEIIRTRSHVQHMSLQLLLLPVWTATLTERDGDIRLALVSGQTGKVAMGLYQKRGDRK